MKLSRNTMPLSAARERGQHSIGEAARRTGLSAKMIRHYESLRLLPKIKRTAGDYRVYSQSDLHTLRFIRRARTLGFSIDEIRDLLGLWHNQRRASAEVKRLATRHIAALEQKIDELESMRDALVALVARCHGDQRPDCPILEDLAALPEERPKS